MTYIQGNYWYICPKTGLRVRVSEVVQQPTKDNPDTGNWVYKGSVDPVHPQEYVTGVEDDPSVPLVFSDNVQVVGETTLLNNMTANTLSVFVVSLTIEENDPVGIVMDNGAAFWSFADEVETLTGEPLKDRNGDLVLDANGDTVTTADPYNGYLVTLGSYIHYDASMGNAVYLPALDNEEWQ